MHGWLFLYFFILQKSRSVPAYYEKATTTASVIIM